MFPRIGNSITRIHVPGKGFITFQNCPDYDPASAVVPDREAYPFKTTSSFRGRQLLANCITHVLSMYC